MELLSRRKKLIKLADRSEAGWALLEEYVEDDLAEDFEDERRIEKAERAAERKIAKRKRDATTTRTAVRHNERTEPLLPDGKRLHKAKEPTALVPFAASTPGACHQCGEFGHWRRECPKRVATGTTYPLLHVVSKNAEYTEDTCSGVKGVCKGNEGVDLQKGDILLPPHGVYPTVKGRLHNCITFWREELCAPPWVLDMLKQGYVLPFTSVPTPYFRPNQHSAHAEAEFVDNAVAELVAGGYVKKPIVCSPLSVVANGVGKKRLVVNLRHVNRYLMVQKFKYEDLRVAMLMFKPGEWMFSFDLKSGYHHVDIYESHQTFLGFEWGSQFYVFTVLPFGLSTAPYVFTKLLRPLVCLWRGKGCKAILYLDDGICAVEREREAVRVSTWVRDTLEKEGFVANEAKCTWTPTHKLQWLGFNIDLEQGELSVPETKLSMLKSLLRCAVTWQCISTRSLASIIGWIISMGLALGPVARFMTRSLYAMLESWEA